MRSLSPEEAELWERVAVTIRPLSRETVEAKPVDKAKRVLPTPTARPVTTKPPPTPPRRPVPIGEKTLDGSWDKKLRSGSLEPDRVLDLHGMSLDTAWAAIDRGLEQ
ncbi:MAG TPA: DNA mismatch repair protein MutS, partial [Sphingomicrobium sp.]